MNNRRLIICDRDREYAGRLAGYMRRSECGYEVMIFTDPEMFVNEYDGTNVYRLLIQEEFLTEAERINPEAMTGVTESGKCLVLTEEEDNEASGMGIYKYQSAANILGAAGEELKTTHSISMASREEGGCRIIGVYSPVSHTLKTTYALTLSRVMGEDKSVLYVNTEGYNGLYELFGIDCGYSLTDLLYEYSLHPEELPGYIMRYVARVDDMNILLPARSSDEIRDIEPLMWLSLLNALSSSSLYSVIVLDLSDEIRGVTELLNVCSTVYMPVRTDVIAMAKLKAFDDCLSRYPGGNEIRNRMVRLKFPYFEDVEGSFNNLRHGRLARYIRQEILRSDEDRLLMGPGIYEQ